MDRSEKLARLSALAINSNECEFIKIKKTSKPIKRKVMVQFPKPPTLEERDLFFEKMHTPYGL